MATVVAREQSRYIEARAVAQDVAAPGLPLEVNWTPVPGATRAEVRSARISLRPAVVEETARDVPVTFDGGWVVSIPSGKRVKALSLMGLKLGAGGVISDSSGLGGMRLAVSFPRTGGGWDSPRFAVPHIPAANMVPASLTGASFAHGLLSLPDSVAAPRVRVSLVTGGSPPEFVVQAGEVSEVHLTTETPARRLTVKGPDGAILWQVPQYDPAAPEVEVDLRSALELAMNARLRDRQALRVSFLVTADPPAQSYVSFPPPQGALLRVREGVWRTELTGDAVPLVLKEPLAVAETPTSVTGDLTITYAGIRILENVSDEGLQPSVAIVGHIVGETGVSRAFPPAAFQGVEPARVGIVGRPATEAELSVEFVAMRGELAGPALGPPAVLELARDEVFRTHWFEVPRGLKLEGPVGLRVRANTGRFYWAGEERPLVRVAIHDPDPGGRPLYLGATRFRSITAAERHEPGAVYRATEFRAAGTSLRSDLFLTVDISDLTLRYAR